TTLSAVLSHSLLRRQRIHSFWGANRDWGGVEFGSMWCFGRWMSSRGASSCVVADSNSGLDLRARSGDLRNQNRALDFEDLVSRPALEQIQARSPQGRGSFVFDTDQFESNYSRLLAVVMLLDHLRSCIQRISRKHGIWMPPFVIPNLPQRIRSCVAARKQCHPREYQPAFDYSSFHETVLARIHFIEVQWVTVASENRQLHVLALADRVPV